MPKQIGTVSAGLNRVVSVLTSILADDGRYPLLFPPDRRIDVRTFLYQCEVLTAIAQCKLKQLYYNLLFLYIAEFVVNK